PRSSAKRGADRPAEKTDEGSQGGSDQSPDWSRVITLPYRCGAICIPGNHGLVVNYDHVLAFQFMKRLLPFERFAFRVKDNHQHSVHGLAPFHFVVSS